MPWHGRTRGFRHQAACLLALLPLALVAPPPFANPLERDLGRNEVRVLSGAYPLVEGRTVREAGLVERLAQLGYERVHRRPERAGEFFWGRELFWIFQRAHRLAGRDHEEQLFGLALEESDGRIVGAVHADGTRRRIERAGELWLEPLLLAESLDGSRAARVPVALDDLPKRIWRPVLAAEDARFFDHVGLDGRALARAMIANVRAGKIRQGGSTITQQLIKMRDLSPKRSLGRKASEALRALALEAEHDKRDILATYINHVYLGHVEGLAVHGLGAAARAYFSRGAQELTLDQAALLAGMIQGPNRLSPIRHPERAKIRRDWVLGRLRELAWAEETEIERALARPVRLSTRAPVATAARHFVSWVEAEVGETAGGRLEKGRGVVVETSIDPWLQSIAEQAIAEQLGRLRRRLPRLSRMDLSAALVALDASTGEVLAYVGGDPGDPDDRFDRVRLARRQPGSTVKPLILLEAFQDCGDRGPMSPATRVADEPLAIEQPSGTWRPGNFDRRFHGVVDLRTAIRHSYNVPLVRVARWCGFRDTSRRFARAGLAMPDHPPPSFALGAVEATPLSVASAFTVFATPGRRVEPLPIRRLERPSGGRLARFRPRRHRVAGAAAAYLVRDLLRDAVEAGTGRAAAIDGLEVAGKTGSSSSLRDAWFTGQAGGVVTAVWVGLDGGGRLGLTGAAAAAPVWKTFMTRAAPARPPYETERPRGVVARRIDPASGLLKSRMSRGGREELFRRGALPPRDRVLRRDRPAPVIR
ncbi:MAG: transglycosylase domain-containing protein [Acidobacteriota bacterium]|nr:transglycosylase domain-containing protein [Acidobacteriota bacterium]